MPIGSYATHRIFPTKKLVKVPNEIELENVVTLMTKGFTVSIFFTKHIQLNLERLYYSCSAECWTDILSVGKKSRL